MMKSNSKLCQVAAISVVSAVTSFGAHAQMTGSPSLQTAEPASRSWLPYTANGYVGGSVGRTNYDAGGCVAFFSCDDEATGFKIYTGGRFSRYFGLELGYVNLGNANRNGGEIKAQGANLSLLGIIPITDYFNVFGKVGGFYGWTRTSTPVAGLPAGKEDGLGLSYGLGVQFDINKTFAVRGEWDRYRVKYVNQRGDADLYTVGLVVKF